MSFENKVGKNPNEQISHKELEKELRSQGISFVEFSIVKESLEKYNHHLPLLSVPEFAGKIREVIPPYHHLRSRRRNFSYEQELNKVFAVYTPEEINSLIDHLPGRVSLINIVDAYNKFKDVIKKDDFKTILSIVIFGEYDFRGALRFLPPDDAKKMFFEGISYYKEFSIVKSCLEKHKHSYTFTPLLEFTKKMKKFLRRHYSLQEDSLNTVLTEYTPEEIDSLIPRLPDGIFLEELSIVKRVLKKHKHSYTFTPLLEFTKKIKKAFRGENLYERSLDKLLTKYTLGEIDSLIDRLPDDISLMAVISMYSKLKDVVKKDDLEVIFLAVRNNERDQFDDEHEYDEYELRTALQFFPLDDVKKMILEDTLKENVIMKKCLEKHNHHLPSASLLEFTKKIIKEFRYSLEEEDLDVILTVYTPEEIDSLIDRLPELSLVSFVQAYYKYKDLVEKEDLEAIFTINQFDKYDFRKALEYLPQALESFPSDDVKKMFSEGISYEELSITKECLEEHNHHLTFSSLLEFTKKIKKYFGVYSLEEKLDTLLTEYTLEEIDLLIARLPKDISLGNVAAIYSEFKDVVEKDDLEAISLISKNKIDLTIVQSCLKKHSHPYTLTSLLEFTKKIRNVSPYRMIKEEDLDTILTTYTLEEIGSLLTRLPKDILLVDVASAYSEFKDVVKKDDLETILFIIQFGEDDFRKALKSLPLDDVKKMFSKGISYKKFKVVKKCLEKYNHHLPYSSLLEFAEKVMKVSSDHSLKEELNIILRVYTLEEIDLLITRLPDDILLVDVAAAYSEFKDVVEKDDFKTIFSIAKFGEDDFRDALSHFPLDDVKKMFSKGIPFEVFSAVKKCLEKHNHHLTFTPLLEFAEKVMKFSSGYSFISSGYSFKEELNTILRVYTLEEIDSLLARLPDDISLVDVASTYSKFKDTVKKDDLDIILSIIRSGRRGGVGA